MGKITVAIVFVKKKCYNASAIDCDKLQLSVNDTKQRCSKLKIAVLGCGAMGMLIGGYLSQKNEVYLIDIDEKKIKAVSEDGIHIETGNGETTHVHPFAVSGAKQVGEVDVVIVFVKALASKTALENNMELFGKNTYVITLQNGAGHEALLTQFVNKERVVIGVTNHNSSIVSANHIKHGGSGKTFIGLTSGNSDALLPIAENFTAGGVETEVQENINKLIWGKLFVNISVSALTGVLQVPIGYIGDSANANHMMEMLVKEAVVVANAMGLDFTEEEALSGPRQTIIKAPNGLTSIYADLRDGRKTEVDTISGAVVAAGKKVGVKTPCHEMIVNMVHAMESRPR